MKFWLKIIYCITSLAIIDCMVQEKPVEKTGLMTIKNGTTFKQLHDSIKIDSVKYRSILDSLLYVKINDSALNSYLDQCYWPYHVRRIKIVPIYNKRGFSTTEADVWRNWMFEKKSVDCGNNQKRQEEFNEVTPLDSMCEYCFLLKIFPFDCPIQYATLDKNRDIIFTESYAMNEMFGRPRLKKKYHLDFFDEKEVKALLNKISIAPEQNGQPSIDGMGIELNFTTINKKFKLERWQYPRETKGLLRFIERKTSVKFPQCQY